MIGRAGRPGFDTHADAVVMVRAEMKEYYKRVGDNGTAAIVLAKIGPLILVLNQRSCSVLSSCTVLFQ